MQIKKLLLPFVAFSIFIVSCRKEAITPDPRGGVVVQTVQPSQLNLNATGFPETFETGSKTAYATANVTLATGSWNFNNALLGTSTSDRKHGTKSVRVQSTGIISMNFNVTTGSTKVTVYYGKYGTDANSTFELWASVNSGSSWAKVGSTITASSTTLA
ncbi:MAG: hypothetical protein ABI237_08130 [Ginsengibacter sp.]